MFYVTKCSKIFAGFWRLVQGYTWSTILKAEKALGKVQQEVLLSSFHLNGHSLGFHPQTQN